MSADETELIQIQRDRFAVNWRKFNPQTVYPRFESVEKLFEEHLKRFSAFCDRTGLGALDVSLSEVTYVNHFPCGKGWTKPGDLGNVVTVWQKHYSDEFLAEPEDVRFSVRYLMNAGESAVPSGRLQISFEPHYTANGHCWLIGIFNAKGKPPSGDWEGVRAFIEEGRKWIVRGFASITTPEMQKIWGRRDNQ